MALARNAGPAAGATLRETLSDIRLHHGEALWVLSELGFRGRRSAATFNEYIKSLRKLGVPFARGEIGYAGRSMANYSYFHLMELALVLSLRVYHAVPDSLLVKIARHRKVLYRHYETAFHEHSSGLGASVVFNVTGSSPLRVRGVFLDLRLNFAGGALVSFGPPTLLSPVEAVAAFAESKSVARALLPINLSLLSERVVAASRGAPLIRRGPKSDGVDPNRQDRQHGTRRRTCGTRRDRRSRL
jgi:hypothetical protein